MNNDSLELYSEQEIKTDIMRYKNNGLSFWLCVLAIIFDVAMFLIITQDYYNILNLTIVPIFDTAFELVGLNPGKNAIAEMQEIGSASTMCAEANGIKGFAENATGGNNGGMPQSLGTMIVCAVKSLETKILTLFDFGDWAFCRGLGPDRMFHIIPHPFYLIDGIVLYIGGLLLMIV